jgi:hypothetical protein
MTQQLMGSEYAKRVQGMLLFAAENFPARFLPKPCGELDVTDTVARQNLAVGDEPTLDRAAEQEEDQH